MSKIGLLIRKEDELIVKFMDKHHDNGLITRIMLFFTFIGSTSFSLLSSAFLLKAFPQTGITLIINLMVSQAIIHSLKRVINRQRPYTKFEDLSPISPPKCSYSLPSGHTGSAFSIGLVLSSSFPAFQALFIIGALLVGFSRIYLVNHYPSDVLAGGIISFAVFKVLGL